MGYPADEVTKLVLGDHLASERQAFTDGVDVRAGVLPDPEAVGCQQAAGHTYHRTLTVGAGDVDSPYISLRVAHGGHKTPHRIETQAMDPPCGGLPVYKPVKKPQGFGVVHAPS